MTTKFAIELFLIVLLASMIGLTWASIVLSAVIQVCMKGWWKERENYIKRMSVLPPELQDHELMHLN